MKFLFVIAIILPAYLPLNSYIEDLEYAKSKKKSNPTCTLDVGIENHISSSIEVVEFWSPFDSRTFLNIGPQGESGIFAFNNEDGFTLCVTIAPNSGTGSIKVYRDHSLVACQNFTSHPTLSTLICFGDDFASDLCPGGYQIYIEPTNC